MKTIGLKLASKAKGLQIFEFDFEKPVQGYDALIQRFIKFFLTPIGTDPLNLEHGTMFARDAFTGMDPLAVEATIIQSVSYAMEKLSEMDSDRDPENALDAAEVRHIYVGPGGDVTVKIELTNKAGTSYLVSLGTGDK